MNETSTLAYCHLTSCQPFDLTDYDWSAELWIAYHDEDEQNARLAGQVWVDNGFDVPETFSQDLLPYLGEYPGRASQNHNTHLRFRTRERLRPVVLSLRPR